MFIKLKEGLTVELDYIKVARVIEVVEGCYNLEISYFDEKKNPKEYIRCDSKEEGEQWVNKIFLEKENSRTIKVR
jgi:hypothetical protein